MSGTIRFSPSLKFRTLQPTTPRGQSRDFSVAPGIFSVSSSEKLCVPKKSLFFLRKFRSLNEEEKIRVSKEGSVQELDDDDAPVSIELTPINSESQFDHILAEAQQLEESVIILWMAKWCRKCIYLKPALEKLAADYHPSDWHRLRFYYVDVNTVPHKLVARAGVMKMPTIQLWKDGKKQGEVIGGNKAYIVIKELLLVPFHFLDEKHQKLHFLSSSSFTSHLTDMKACSCADKKVDNHRLFIEKHFGLSDWHRLRFYYVDVNTVPHKLVARTGVMKIPTIQLWKDGKKQGEVIGGNKTYIVINEVRRMIENESTL